MALTECVLRVGAEVLRAPFGERLQLVLNGAFNDVASQADNVVREQVRRQSTRVNQTRPFNPTVELPVTRQPEAEVLLAELRNHPALTERERAVLELQIEGRRTQVEIAKQLQVSQPRVNQLLSTARRKLQSAIESV